MLRSYERHKQTTTDRRNCDDIMRNVTYRSNVGLKSRFSTSLPLYLRNDIMWGRSCYGMRIEQELSYRKQIARQLRTQYAEGIYRHKYYTVILKSRLRVTQGDWKRNHWIDHTRHSSSQVIWRYRDLEMWVRGHSRSLKVVPFASLGMFSYLPSIVTITVSLAISEIFSIKHQVWGRSRSLKLVPFESLVRFPIHLL